MTSASVTRIGSTSRSIETRVRGKTANGNRLRYGSPEPRTDEELELAALCGIAWEQRELPDFRTHVERIVDWHDRRHVRRFERKQRQFAYLVQVLRETDPHRDWIGEEPPLPEVVDE